MSGCEITNSVRTATCSALVTDSIILLHESFNPTLPLPSHTTTTTIPIHTSMPTATAGDSNNPFAALIEQEIVTLPSFTFESGVELHDVPVAYKTWGRLNAAGDNVIVINHALTGSADVEDW